jgi:S1-C subfamily serine protease
MSGPKHLWSGDWQQDSAAASDALADLRAQPAPGEPAVDPAPAPRRRRPRPSRTASIVLVAVLFLAAAAYGLSALLGPSGNPASTTAGIPRTPAALPLNPATTTTAALARPINWLGMEIQTLPPGAAVVETVGPGTPGDQAGLEPGDTIVEVNHHTINGAGDISAALRGLHSGDVVEIQVSHGSALFQTEASLTVPPSVGP